MEKSTELTERIKLAREETSTTSEGKLFQISVTLSEKMTTLQCKNNDALQSYKGALLWQIRILIQTDYRNLYQKFNMTFKNHENQLRRMVNNLWWHCDV